MQLTYNTQILGKIYYRIFFVRRCFVDLHIYFIITEADSNNMMSCILKTDEELTEIVDESNLELKDSKQIQVTEEKMISSSYNVEREYNNKSIQFDYMVTVTG